MKTANAFSNGHPLVAVTTSTAHEPSDPRKSRSVLDAGYVQALERMGLAPLLITPGHGAGSWQRLLDLSHGLVLTGGHDIDPGRYGREPSLHLGEVDRPRDEMEFAVLTGALERRIPVLGICRGHQVINVHFGGTLYQDLTDELGVGSHDQPGDWTQSHHTVRAMEDTRIQRCLGFTNFQVNSFHHQAVENVGRGLRVTACSDDGVIEAIESEEDNWLMGVQWHPERGEAHSEDGDPNRCVFRAFAQAVREG